MTRLSDCGRARTRLRRLGPTRYDSAVEIRRLLERDWPRVRAIYVEGIASGLATFEAEAPADWLSWASAHLEVGRLVAVDAEGVVGWAALSPVSDRCVYAGVAEVSVYVAEGQQGRGVGTALLASVIAESEENGLWTLQAGIFPENISSVKLHEKVGFRVVGRRERLGKNANGEWNDVLFLERRSAKVGAD